MTTAKKPDWVSLHLLFLKGLKSPNEAQQLFIFLAEKKVRNEKDEKIFSTLVKSEKAEKKASEARLAVSNLIASEKETARKARTHALIQLGLIFEYAEIGDASRNFLMGMALEGARADEYKRSVWEKDGKDFLAKKESASVAAVAPISSPAPTPAPAPKYETCNDVVFLTVSIEEKDAAKALGARWNADLKKWFVPAGVDLTPFKKWL